MSFAAKFTQAVALPKATSAAESDDDENAQLIELEDRLVAEPFVLRYQAMLEKKDLVQQLKGDNRKSGPPSGGGEEPDLRQVKAAAILNAAASECEDSNKLSEWGIHSLTHSVTDELSRPISEVEDDSHLDQTEVSSENRINVSPPRTVDQRMWRGSIKEDEDYNPLHGSELEADDFEGADGEIESVSGDQSQMPHSEEPSLILSPNGALREGNEEQEGEDGEVFQASQDLTDEEQPTKVKSYSLSGQHYPPESDSSPIQNNLEEKTTDSTGFEVRDAASNLGTLSTEPRGEDEGCAQQPRLDSEISLFFPQQLDPEDVINPFSLEVRIRKAREQQDISLGWEAETIAENIVGISQPQVNLEETSRSILPEIFPEQPTGSSKGAVENGFHPQVRERIRAESVPEDLVEDSKDLSQNKPGVGEAVLLGALASGVNRPTWFVIRAVLVALVASLLLLLHVAIKSDSWLILLNVLFLIAIAGGLILLLGWYVSQIGLVSVDKQMAELNLTSEPQMAESKTL